MFKNIYDIRNNKYYPIKSNRGIEILKSYINKIGGSNLIDFNETTASVL